MRQFNKREFQTFLVWLADEDDQDDCTAIRARSLDEALEWYCNQAWSDFWWESANEPLTICAQIGDGEVKTFLASVETAPSFSFDLKE